MNNTSCLQSFFYPWDYFCFTLIFAKRHSYLSIAQLFNFLSFLFQLQRFNMLSRNSSTKLDREENPRTMHKGIYPNYHDLSVNYLTGLCMCNIKLSQILYDGEGSINSTILALSYKRETRVNSEHTLEMRIKAKANEGQDLPTKIEACLFVDVNVSISMSNNKSTITPGYPCNTSTSAGTNNQLVPHSD